MENKNDKCATCGNEGCDNKCNNCVGLSGCMNGRCSHGHCRILKKLFVLAIIILAFWFGECVGQLKSEIRANHGYGRGGMMYNWDRPMMDGYYKDFDKSAQKEVAPSTTETPAKQ